jgi:hypothetical protein
VLRQLGHAICLSGHTAGVVKTEMGDAFPVFPVACAVWNRLVDGGGVRLAGPQIAPRELRIRGTIIDTATLALAPELVGTPGFPPPVAMPEPPPPEAAAAEPTPEVTLPEVTLPEPAPEVVEEPKLSLPTFEPEPSPPAEALPEPTPEPLSAEPEWIAEPEPIEEPRIAAEPPRNLRYRLAVTKRHATDWYREAIRDLLPGPVRWLISRLGMLAEWLYRASKARRPPAAEVPSLSVEAEAVPQAEVAQQAEAPPHTEVPEQAEIPPHTEVPQQAEVPPHTEVPQQAEAPPQAEVSVQAAPPPEAAAPEPEPLREAEPAPAPAPPPTPPRWPEVSVEVSGIVYTSVLNPVDGRKNWPDILTAFCWAFRDVPDATLILKMVRNEAYPYAYELYIALAQLAPFKCRVIIMQGFLEEDAYGELMEATSFYVNASNAERLCLPLMEFMASGKPAIAPRHTALEDYIDPSVAFIVGSSPEHNIWPNDPRKRFCTMRERIHWDTLVEAYEESYRVAKTDQSRYRAMAARASEAIRDYSSDDVICERLRTAMAHMPAPAGAAAAAHDALEDVLEAAAQ